MQFVLWELYYDAIFYRFRRKICITLSSIISNRNKNASIFLYSMQCMFCIIRLKKLLIMKNTKTHEIIKKCILN